jgi:hypothetical protein
MTGSVPTLRAFRRARGVLVSSIALVALLLHGGAASAESVLAVSTFDDNRPQAAGTTAVRSIRLSNLSDQPLELSVLPRAIDLLNDGQTHVRADEDPRWAGQIDISPSSLSLAGRTSQDVSVRITIPSDTPPDDYVLGVVVTTKPVGPGIRVVAEVAALVPISVEGDRPRSLEMIGHQLPNLIIGDQVSGTIRVGNPGTTLVSAWLEADVHNAWTGQSVANIQERDHIRVAAGASRDFAYTWQSGVTAGLFTIPARVTYNSTNATTAQLDVEDSVWLIHPYFVALAVSLLLFALLAVAAMRQRGAVRRLSKSVPTATCASEATVASTSSAASAEGPTVERAVADIGPEPDREPAAEEVDTASVAARALTEVFRARRANLASDLLAQAEREVRELQARQMPAAERMQRSHEIVARVQRQVQEVLALGEANE